ncbi:amino acid adenylation domain-containing protein [Streptomyces fulvorobeus]|uniref:Amino acid adenylation domain-containing protein n=2 Tax=Streptomyces fulvorobeus TaxID=284028 RepID=A0A7Y9HHD2_9ACTN|nr:non-ribosomal peptide synthetase [Streptomyces fulvorobeus]NYE44600.1 amino acid adenylation domain-containing protein [Streptomyces fulvorobeus]
MRRSLQDVLPLSPLQEGLLFHSEYVGDEAVDVYTVQTEVELRGPLDVPALRAAAEALLRRHDNLRAGFATRALKDPVQFVPREVELPWEEADLRAADDPDAEAARRLEEHRWRRFRPSKPPLVRFLLLRMAHDRYRFALTNHHILLDGWSMPMLLRELMLLYRTGGDASALPPVRRYRDYLAWLGSRDSGAAQDAWRGALAGLEAPTLIAPRADRAAEAPRWLDFALSKTASAGLTAAARGAGLTLNTVVQGLWALTLARTTGSQDLVYGVVVSGRPPELEGVESMIGLFANTVPLRARMPVDEPLIGFLRRLQREQSALLDHQHLRLADIQRQAGRGELFDSVMAFENYPDGSAEEPSDPSADAPGRVRVVASKMRDAMHYPLGLLASPGPPMRFRLGHRPSAVTPRLAAALRDRLLRLVDAFLAAPDLPLGRLDVLDDTERALVLEKYNDTAREVEDITATELFLRQAARTPGRIAVETAERSLDYARLADRSGRLARLLAQHGARAEQFVALVLPRSPELVETALAVWQTGAAYVPVDPTHPADRVARLLREADPVLTITTADLADRLPAGLPLLVLDAPSTAAALRVLPGGPLDPGELPAPVGPQNAAYAIYTSGSTGRPKGVVATHCSLVGYLLRGSDQYPSDGRSLVHSPVSFDLTVGALYVPLISGGTVRLASLDDEPVLRPGEASPDFVKVTPSHLPVLEGLPGEVSPTGAITFGGEQLTGRHLRRWRADHPDVTVYNVYGPTETTVNCSEHRIAPRDPVGDGPVPIGRPLWNTRLFVLGPGLAPVPVGVPGELYVAGAGLARGYLRDPGRTAERFVACPYAVGERMYRTGDLVRWNEDGLLEYLGRVDDQISLRGFRVEPGEVEAALAAHPAVRRAAVVLREDTPGDARLVAYAVPTEPEGPQSTPPSAPPMPTEQILEHLRRTLPPYMVPAHLMELPALPVTPHGKIDRAALPEPSVAGAPAGGAPRSPREEILCGIFADVLRRPQVSIDDDFFALGGHSLLATRLASRVRAALDAEMPVRRLFEHPTVRSLSALLDSHDGRRPPVTPAPRPEHVPLSYAQQRLWIMHRLTGPDATYNIHRALRLDGDLDVPALEAALQDVTERHETLRTVFPEGAEGPYQKVLPARRAAGTLTVLPVAGQEVDRTLAELAAHRFDLESEPPMRAWLLESGPRSRVLVLVLHHIASDGWSGRRLLRDLFTAYTARRAGRAPQWRPLPVQYADYALWQRRYLGDPADPASPAAVQLDYWEKQLAGLPQELRLPADRPRPARPTRTGGQVWLTLPATVHSAVADLARTCRASVFMVVQAAVAAFLTRMGAGEDIPIGAPVAGRTDEAVEELVGFFVSTLVLRTDTSGDPTFTELVGRVRETALAAYAHQDLPFEQLVERLSPTRSLGRHPLFQVALSCNNTEEQMARQGGRPPGLTVTPHQVETARSKFDLMFTFLESHGEDGQPSGIETALEYSADLFDRETAQSLLDRFGRMLAIWAAEPADTIGARELLAADERHTVVTEWNATRRAGLVATLPRMFQEQVARTPHATALEHAGQALTYAELNARANRLAGVLVRRGIRPEDRVATLMSRSPGQITALLAIAKAGGAAVPVDPGHPEQRIAFMLRDSACALVLAGDPYAAGREEIAGVPVLVPDDEPAQEPATDLADGDRNAPLTAGNAAYVVYTSGSTGRPKGVVTEHRGLLSLATAQRERYPVEPGSRVLQLASPSFDGAVLELLMALTTGGTLVLPDGPLLAGQPLAEMLAEHRISHAFIPPAVLSGLPSEGLDGLRCLAVGGEAVTAPLVDRWARGRRMLDVYGPTETTAVTLTSEALTPGGPPPAIGTPVPNTRAYVLDDRLRPVPPGVMGELYLAGASLARGYGGRPALTASRYVGCPFGEPGERMYRTGDLARRDREGRVHHMGRTDEQIKLRGFRVEPGEIRARLTDHPAVREAAVVLREDGPGGRALVAYVVPADGPPRPTATRLRAHLTALLPPYMVPAAFLVLDALPTTANGKLDRDALPAPEPLAEEAGRPPRDEREAALCEVFAEVLERTSVGADDGFFENGGHSLLAVRLVARVRERLGVPLAARDLFEAPTPAALAARIGRGAERRAPAPLLTLRGRGDQPPLFCVHPAVGLGWAYASLLPWLPADVPVHALQARTPADGAGLPGSVEEMADDYVRLIRRVRPHGPYRLLGWSLGAHVAHTAAGLLERDGQRVDLLAMLDAYPPHRTGDPGGRADGSEAEIVAANLRESGFAWEEADQRAGRFPLERFRAHLRRVDSSLGHLDDAELTAAKDVYVNNVRLMRSFTPGRVRCGIVLMTAERTRGLDPAAWEAHTDGGVEVHRLDAAHMSMLTEPTSVAEAGRVLTRRLDSLRGATTKKREV